MEYGVGGQTGLNAQQHVVVELGSRQETVYLHCMVVNGVKDPMFQPKNVI